MIVSDRTRQATNDNILVRMHFTCWITEVTKTSSEYIIGPDYCFSSPTVAKRKCLNVKSSVPLLCISLKVITVLINAINSHSTTNFSSANSYRPSTLLSCLYRNLSRRYIARLLAFQHFHTFGISSCKYSTHFVSTSNDLYIFIFSLMSAFF